MEARLVLLNPHIVCVQETWLDASVPDLTFHGYRDASRRGRVEVKKAGYGGIRLLVRNDLDCVVELCHGEIVEYIFLTVHISIGPILLCNWYRLGDAGRSAIDAFREDYEKLIPDHVGAIVIGDLNIHQRSRLTYSSNNTPDGRLM